MLVSRFIAIVSLLACAACAQITSRLGASPDEAPKPRPASTSPAAAATDKAPATAEGSDLSELRAGLPGPLVTMVEKLYSEPHIQRNYLEVVQAERDRFEPKWAAYEARRPQVSAAVGEAEELVGRGRLDDARAVLEAVITPTPRNEQGEVERSRAMVEPVDAELPAVFALLEVAKAQGDMRRIVEITRDLFVRRKVGERERELMIWFAHAHRKRVHSLGGLGGEDKSFVESLLKDAHDAAQAGDTMALEYYASLPGHGIARGRIEAGTEAAPGSWMVLRFQGAKHAKVTGDRMQWSKKTAWQEPYNCKITDRVASIDPVTGSVRYHEDCKFRSKSSTVSMRATLAEPMPGWAPARFSIDLLARVDSAGPNWVLSEVVVFDNRFLEQAEVFPWRSPF